MKKFLKIQGWTINFLEIYKVVDNRIILNNGKEIILSKEEQKLLSAASDRMGLPNLFMK